MIGITSNVFSYLKMLLTTIKQAKKARKETSKYIIRNAMVQVKWNNVFFCLKWHWFMAQIFQIIIFIPSEVWLLEN